MANHSIVDTPTDKNVFLLSPDGFTRYYLLSRIINAYNKTPTKTVTLLDVGGKGTLLPKFLDEKKSYRITVLDILPEDKKQSLPYTYRQASATKQPFRENTFDVVVSTDVLEHIVDKQKKKFLSECIRVAKDIVVIAAPLQHPIVDTAEHIANDFYRQHNGEDHLWLKEHFVFGKPKAEVIETYLSEQNLSFVKFESNNIHNWLATTLPSFLIPKYPQLLPKLQELNSFFNTHLFALNDFQSPGYRTFYIIFKNKKRVLAKKDIIRAVIDHQKMLRLQKLSTDLLGAATEQTDKAKKQLEVAHYELHQVYSSKKYKLLHMSAKLLHVSKRLIKNPKRFVSLIKILFHSGPKGIIIKFKQLFFLKSINDQYAIWVKNHALREHDLIRQREQSKQFLYRPLISIITPTYNTPKTFLIDCIESVLAQTYDNWELCLADDASTHPHVVKILKSYSKKDIRIKVVWRKQNGHISEASNTALESAHGEFIALLDHDDVLWPNALFETVQLLKEYQDADFIYTDEDKLDLDGKTHVDPFFKPDWSPDYLRSINYITHFAVIRKSLAIKAGSFRKGYEGAQDWDLFLRTTQLTNKVYHIPTILYSWRKSPFSTASEKHAERVKRYAYDAQKKAIADDIQRRGYTGNVVATSLDGVWRVQYDIFGNAKVSIIIPTKDAYGYITKCITSIQKKTTYKNYEILVIDTGSTDNSVLTFYKKLRLDKRIRILHWKKAFNFSAVCNYGAKMASGDYLLFLNNDTEVITLQWLEGMLEHAQRDWVGAVGAKLLYPDGTIQHLGGILGIPGDDHEIGIAGHAFRGNFGEFLHHDRLSIKNYSFVTGACLMVSRKKFEHIGGFNEAFRIAWNDIDLCLRLYSELKLYNLVTPHVALIHHEAVTIKRPGEKGRDMAERKREIELFRSKWEGLRKRDPFYNANLSLKSERYDLLTL